MSYKDQFVEVFIRWLFLLEPPLFASAAFKNVDELGKARVTCYNDGSFIRDHRYKGVFTIRLMLTIGAEDLRMLMID